MSCIIHIDGLEQDRGNSSALAMEILISWEKAFDMYNQKIILKNILNIKTFIQGHIDG